MKYSESNSPEEFLRHVLENWTAFRKANGGLCKAIENLLEKVEQNGGGKTMRNIIGGLLFIAALVLMIGAAGGLENGLCSFGEMLIMEAVGFGMMLVSYLCVDKG